MLRMPDPRETPVSPFLHQIDEFGIYHSVCSACLQTVFKSTRESKLLKGEEVHHCQGPSQTRRR